MHLDEAKGRQQPTVGMVWVGEWAVGNAHAVLASTVTLTGSLLGHILLNYSRSCASRVHACYTDAPKQADFAFHCSDHHKDYEERQFLQQKIYLVQ